nr:unnamed protein product [Spirometra erinaceieuropaei]
MAYVRLRGHFTNISIVSVYAPTSAAEQRDKEALYSQLQALVERLPHHDLLIVAGDWNGRTGPGDPTTSHLLGRFGLGSRYENGERLLNFADRNRLLVTNTCFRHRKKRLLTWYSNDGHTASQIDYILASNVGDTRKLYRLIRQVSGKPSTLSDSVRDVNGGFIADNSAKVERWREHFEHHLNFDAQPTSPLFSSSAEFLPSPIYAVPCDPPSEEEVPDAIRKLRNNKGPGEDGIPADIFKSCVDTLAPWPHGVIERVWRDEVVLDDWGLGILVPILKKGDKTRCENYRGISLIDDAAKIFAVVLLRRFQAMRDSRTRPNQAGFRAGRGCADQIFTLRRILEFRHSYQQPTAVCFIDFAAAFDSVHRESLWRIMALDGVSAKIIAMIKAYYRSTNARILVRNNLPQPFGSRSGVRQGCILSPILFNYAVDWIFGRALQEGDGVEFATGHRLTDLDYADDIALLASSFADLQSVVSRVKKVAESAGLSINVAKIKVSSSCIPDQE